MSKSFNDCMYWDKNLGVNVILFDRIKKKRVERKVTSDAFFVFHHANSYEKDGFLVLDYAKILSPGNFDDLLLEHMRTGGFRSKKSGFKPFLHRMIVPLNVDGESKPGDNLLSSCKFAGDCQAVLQKDGSIHCIDMKICDISLEFPRYCYDLNMCDYRYVVKVDLKDGTSKVWCKDAEDQLCGEPILVNKPGYSREDEGVLIVPVITCRESDRPYVVVLDAETMEERARFVVPQSRIPLGLLRLSCGQGDYEWPIQETTSTYYAWTTEPGSTTTQSTSAFTSTQSWTSAQPWNPTSAPSPIVDQCTCTDKNIWLDIYFVMDASFAMTSPGFDGYDLTQWQSTMDMLSNMDLPFSGSRGTNIEAGIRIAAERFGSAEHRVNAQKVIVIVASAYETGKYSDPTEVADTFKEDGGIIITVEYVQEHGAVVPKLGNLSSPGPYQFTNRFGNLTNEDLRQAFCKANCFCPTNYDPFTWGDTVPHGGCYRTIPLTAIQLLANNNCRKQHNGTLAKVESRDKSLFLAS
ncbi:hypothetical protein GCK32_005402 [Trichostrongylus colubriformis]|uniref:VWFA domain-containing protein n=1 Tax=Trichostrongylus colubriformis TaxID=6319 RepID=A0AAN8G831_TRICO